MIVMSTWTTTHITTIIFLLFLICLLFTKKNSKVTQISHDKNPINEFKLQISIFLLQKKKILRSLTNIPILFLMLSLISSRDLIPRNTSVNEINKKEIEKAKKKQNDI